MAVPAYLPRRHPLPRLRYATPGVIQTIEPPALPWRQPGRLSRGGKWAATSRAEAVVKCREMYERGMSVRQIAAETGISKSAVHSMIQPQPDA
ncbi:helix-turn-helix domain-containing protein [uncultured Muribaculum sp.]|uniref:helix-turn-helix domain-containing protein n=1 Tax=uncultured Muribaculum sp. TaxID=1918613 RepID=UPI00262E0DA9|nr:helix-turn-helix domain-containing protein [uncultured Muribaculum sp.]